MIRSSLIALLFLVSVGVQASSVRDLKYGTILFDYYQQNYFDALIGYEVAKERNELEHNENEARLLQGGMALSYGLPEKAENIFSTLLDKDISEGDRNKAWYYLAKLYYQKHEDDRASSTLGRVKGDIPNDIHKEFNYLATLINIRNQHLDVASDAIQRTAKGSVYEPYLIFNLAASQLKNGQLKESDANFSKVIQYAVTHPEEEYEVLADRAKQAQAHVDIKDNDLLSAWGHLQHVRTTGLYSNRALLSYGWTAIKLNQFKQAIPALKALDSRSVSIAEVQEAKVLLAHLYEQQGAPRTALKHYLLAEKAFKEGVESIAGARKVIAAQKIPEEFVVNLDAMMDETDWYGSEPSLDFNKLTPFLIELMSSNPFHIVLKELRDLYAIRKNLVYWTRQAEEHQLILAHRHQGWTSDSLTEFVDNAEEQKDVMEEKISELKLHAVTMAVEEQKRFDPLVESMDDSFDFLEEKIEKVRKIQKPYKESEENLQWMKTLHKRIAEKLDMTDRMIERLERVMRRVVNAELDKHEERMKYYWAQARLGKARLYDQTLSNFENEAANQTGAPQ